MKHRTCPVTRLPSQPCFQPHFSRLVVFYFWFYTFGPVSRLISLSIINIFEFLTLLYFLSPHQPYHRHRLISPPSSCRNIVQQKSRIWERYKTHYLLIIVIWISTLSILIPRKGMHFLIHPWGWIDN